MRDKANGVQEDPIRQRPKERARTRKSSASPRYPRALSN